MHTSRLASCAVCSCKVFVTAAKPSVELPPAPQRSEVNQARRTTYILTNAIKDGARLTQLYKTGVNPCKAIATYPSKSIQPIIGEGETWGEATADLANKLT
jgi:hypothetical protein